MEYFPTQIQLSRPIQKNDVQIETVCCIFKQIRINWLSINVTGISRTMITMPDTAYISIFMDNDLTHITEDHFKIKLIARLLDQMYVIQPPPMMMLHHQHLSSQSICIHYLPTHKHRVWLYGNNLLYIRKHITMDNVFSINVNVYDVLV